MKPTISIALITLVLTFPSPAMAAPTHLTCTETKSDDGKFRTMQLLVNADRGYAKYDDQEMSVTARPTELVLKRVERTPDRLIHTMVINRQTLAFRRGYLFHPYGNSDFGTDRETSGQCRITPAPAGRQI